MGRAHGFHACKFTGIVLHAYYPDFGSSYPSFCVLGAPILMKKPESASRSRQGPTHHHRKTLNYNLLLCQSEISASFCGAQIGCGRGSDIFKKTPMLENIFSKA